MLQFDSFFHHDFGADYLQILLIIIICQKIWLIILKIFSLIIYIFLL